MNEKLQEDFQDPEFMKVLEDSESYYEDATSFYTWNPDDGENTCVLTSVKHDVVNDSKLEKDVLRVRAIVTIQYGDDAGQDFDLSGRFGWTPRNFTGLKTLASLLSGRTVAKLPEAMAILYDNIGTGLVVGTKRSQREDGGEPYVNHMPRRIVNIEEETPAPPQA